VSAAIAIYRRPSLSPGVHRQNDVAILTATMAALERLGWQVRSFNEDRIERGEPLPEADLYLNMCQGPEASQRLLALEERAVFVNRPSSVLACHRARLVARLEGSGVPFAESRVVRPGADRGPWLRWLDADPAAAGWIWLKRGDVHAEGPDDVRPVRRAELDGALDAFFRRRIPSVVAQRHLEGPLVKFYGIGGVPSPGAWFRWFFAEGAAPGVLLDEPRLRAAAFAAGSRLGLEVFGGDAIVVAPDRPVLIDVNDWPSFARFRPEAAAAIARHVHQTHASGPRVSLGGVDAP
jgi:hypothetical protein